MPFFTCRFKTKNGRSRKEVLFAPDSESVRRMLLTRGDFPLAITPTKRVPGQERMSFSQAKEWAETLSMLLDSGHTITESMKLMQRFQGKGIVRKTAELLEGELGRGLSFRQALEAVPIRFPPGFVPFAGIGESVGSLSAVMGHVAEYYGRLGRLRDRIGTAMIYPALVLFVALVAGTFLSIVTLPSLREMMTELNSYEGGAAASVEEVSIVPRYFIALAAAIVILGVIFLLRRRNTQDEHSASRLLLKLPVLGAVFTHWDLMGWSFSMELLSGQGVPMDRALKEGAETVGNRYLHSRLEKLSSHLSKGEKLSGLMSREPEIPEIVSGWLAIGEETGNVTKVFKTLREYFERRVLNFIELATQLIEPALILILGLLMLILVGKYVLPVFRLMGNLL